MSDFRNLNKQLKLKLYPMPNIIEMLFNLECYQYAASLYLDMGYCHIQLTEDASNICMIILPWGGYCYKRLTMRIANSPDILQHNMKDIFHGFGFICAYIDELLILKNENGQIMYINWN